MLHYLSVLRIIVLGVSAAAACTVHAQETTDIMRPPEEGAKRWGVGIGVGIERSPYRDFGNKTSALPWLFYNGERFRFAGNTADFKLGSVSNFDFALRAKYSNEGYKSGDASILSGMDERKDGFWLGASAGWHTPFSTLALEWLKDASGNSSGQTVKLGAGYEFVSGRMKFTPHAGVAWVDSNYVDYYYGVRSSEAIAGRGAYTGKSTVNTNIGLLSTYSLTPAQSILLDVTTTRYGSGITDSPLIDRSTSTKLLLQYLYKF